jgi:8-oxo-dGTP pyrophosphatase MutT (NUDIX family)
MLKELDKISTETKFVNPYWEYRLDRYTMPSGKAGEYHYVNSRGSTIVIPRKDDDNFIFVNQLRYLNHRTSIEFPGGGLKVGRDSKQNAVEELKEETGYVTHDLKLIGEYNPFNGVTNEICKVYLADNLFPENSTPDESEEFEILELKTNEIIDKIISGEIWDGMTLAAWSIYIAKYSK